MNTFVNHVNWLGKLKVMEKNWRLDVMKVGSQKTKLIKKLIFCIK